MQSVQHLQGCSAASGQAGASAKLRSTRQPPTQVTAMTAALYATRQTVRCAEQRRHKAFSCCILHQALQVRSFNCLKGMLCIDMQCSAVWNRQHKPLAETWVERERDTLAQPSTGGLVFMTASDSAQQASLGIQTMPAEAGCAACDQQSCSKDRKQRGAPAGSTLMSL